MRTSEAAMQLTRQRVNPLLAFPQLDSLELVTGCAADPLPCCRRIGIFKVLWVVTSPALAGNVRTLFLDAELSKRRVDVV